MKERKLETILNLFEGNEIRSTWNSEEEEYYFSVVDVIGALTESSRARKYWNDLKIRLTNEGSELSDKIGQLKMQSADGKYYNTDVWKDNGITSNYEYGILTNEIYKEWSGMSANEYKAYKGLRKESLRDNMTDVEDALTNLGEIATRELAKKHKPYGLEQNKKIAKMGGNTAKVARMDLENKLNESVITSDNKLDYKYLDNAKIENK